MAGSNQYARPTLSSSGMSSCTKPPAELPHPAATALAVPTILRERGQGGGMVL